MVDDLDPAAVERAARAAYEEAYDEPERPLHPWDAPWVKQAWLDIARAALAAARPCTCQGPSPCSDGPDVDCPRHGDGLAAARDGGAVMSTVDCKNCGGSGEAPDPDPHDERWYPCPACGGTGEVREP